MTKHIPLEQNGDTQFKPLLCAAIRFLKPAPSRSRRFKECRYLYEALI